MLEVTFKIIYRHTISTWLRLYKELVHEKIPQRAT